MVGGTAANHLQLNLCLCLASILDAYIGIYRQSGGFVVEQNSIHKLDKADAADRFYLEQLTGDPVDELAFFGQDLAGLVIAII